MCRRGGYIHVAAHGRGDNDDEKSGNDDLNSEDDFGKLVRLNVASLAKWNARQQQQHAGETNGSVIDGRRDEDVSSNSETTATNEACCIVEPEILSHPFGEERIQTLSSPNKEEEQVPILSEVLFVYKPSGLLTLPGIGPDKADCLASRVNEWLEITEEGQERKRQCLDSSSIETRGQQKRRRKKNGKPKRLYVPRPCHRLDYDTSGIIAVALTPDAQRWGQMLFQERLTTKSYIALVAGHLYDDEGIVEYGIGKIPTGSAEGIGYNRWACDIPDRDVSLAFTEGSVRPARTEWRVSARLTVPLSCSTDDKGDEQSGVMAKYTRVELKPITGRGRQLRLHMAAIGHPILGDELHAPSEVANAAPRLCLHAETLALPVMDIGSAGGTVLASATYPAPF